MTLRRTVHRVPRTGSLHPESMASARFYYFRLLTTSRSRRAMRQRSQGVLVRAHRLGKTA